MLTPFYCLKSAILVLIIPATISCSSQQYVNQPVSKFQDFECFLSEITCGGKSKRGYLTYIVTALENNEYLVEGELQFDWLSHGSSRWVEFYLLFMDVEKVVYEKKVRTISTTGSFRFKAQIDAAVVSTSITQLQLWTRS